MTHGVTMTNPQLMGVLRAGRADHFNMKGSMCVVALFGIITIISYFNELNKAGLLRRGVILRPLYINEHHRSERAINEHNTIIQKNGNLHHVGLEILRIQENSNHKKHNTVGDEINIKLHLGQNSSYEKINNSPVPIYHHKNTLPNFYTTLNMSLYDISAFNSTSKALSEKTNSSHNAMQTLAVLRKKYQGAVLVYAHQHEPHTHLLRDCLKNISREKRLVISNVPINRNFRKQWDSLPKHKRNSFDVLHGGVTFGVCETIGRPCSYITLVAHPVDRLVALHDLCHSPHNSSLKTLCQLNNRDGKPVTLKQFMVAQGSGLFEKLVYYAKHCRLIGDDEICLQGLGSSFVLSREETEAHLNHIIQHIETWFATIGLIEHFPESLALLQSIYGYPFSECHKRSASLYGAGTVNKKTPGWLGFVQKAGQGWVQPGVLGGKYRNVLLRDPDVKQALHADIVIYDKMVEIYKRQVKNKEIVRYYQKRVRKVKYHINNVERGMKEQVKHTKGHQSNEHENQWKKARNKIHEMKKSKLDKHKHDQATKMLSTKVMHAPPKLTLKKGTMGNYTAMEPKSVKSQKAKQKKNHKGRGMSAKKTKGQKVHDKAMPIHLKKQTVSSTMTTTEDLFKKVPHLLRHHLPIKRTPKKNTASKKLVLKPVLGMDELLVQNLSALELSKFHAEGVRPGTLEKANAIHFRHLPHIELRRQKQKQK